MSDLVEVDCFFYTFRIPRETFETYSVTDGGAVRWSSDAWRAIESFFFFPDPPHLPRRCSSQWLDPCS